MQQLAAALLEAHDKAAPYSAASGQGEETMASSKTPAAPAQNAPKKGKAYEVDHPPDSGGRCFYLRLVGSASRRGVVLADIGENSARYATKKATRIKYFAWTCRKPLRCCASREICLEQFAESCHLFEQRGYFSTSLGRNTDTVSIRSRTTTIDMILAVVEQVLTCYVVQQFMASPPSGFTTCIMYG